MSETGSLNGGSHFYDDIHEHTENIQQRQIRACYHEEDVACWMGNGWGGGVKTDCSVLIKGTLYVGEDSVTVLKIEKIPLWRSNWGNFQSVVFKEFNLTKIEDVHLCLQLHQNVCLFYLIYNIFINKKYKYMAGLSKCQFINILIGKCVLRLLVCGS